MDNADPALKKVPRIPEAAPRWFAGTLLMMAAVFGEENNPEPTPFSATSSANSQYGKFTGISSSAMKVAPTSSRPPVANQRAPKRSE